MRTASGILATVGLLVAWPSAAAAAPTVTVEYPCYTPGMVQHVTGSGFTPTGPVQLDMYIGSEQALEHLGRLLTTADAAGAIDVHVRTPDFEHDRGLGVVVAIDGTLASQGAPPDVFAYSLGFDVSQWYIDVARWAPRGPARGKPGRRTRVTAAGWVGSASTTLFAHYVRRGKLVKTARVGRLEGTCGDFSGRMTEFPFRRAKAGTYRVVFDTTRGYPNDDWSISYRRVIVGGRRAIASAVLADPIARLRTTARVLEYR